MNANDVTTDTDTFEDYVKKHGHQPVTVAMLGAAIDELMSVFVAQHKEIEKLKARPLQKWAGVHVAGAQYSEASLVTKGGSLWVATTTTTTIPGEAGGAWRLIVKKGDAR